MSTGRTLVVTNDFPPRQGGIESFVYTLAAALPPESVVVYASRSPDAARFDARVPFPVHRDRSATLLPLPHVTRRAARLLDEEGCDSVLFGAAAPLGLLAPDLRAAGARRLVALTHGHETWWARVPGTRAALRRIGDTTDVLTYLGPWTRRRIAAALSPEAAARMAHLPPGVDAERFRPGCGGDEVRRALSIPPERPVVVCVARLTPRKGQDALVRSLPAVLRRSPDALLLLVGGGPDRTRLEQLVDSIGVRRSVRFAGPVAWEAVPAYFDAGNVFAMPCRTRRGGLEPEALGIVFLEASAIGLPVVVGDSGGAPDACLPGETGYVVDGRRLEDIADRVSRLLVDRELAGELGRRGRQWVQEQWRWDVVAERMRGLLAPGMEDGRPDTGRDRQAAGEDGGG